MLAQGALVMKEVRRLRSYILLKTKPDAWWMVYGVQWGTGVSG